MFYLVQKFYDADKEIVGGLIITYFLFIPIRLQAFDWRLDESHKINYNLIWDRKDLDVLLFLLFLGPLVPLLNKFPTFSEEGTIENFKFGFRKKKVLQQVYVDHFINEL